MEPKLALFLTGVAALLTTFLAKSLVAIAIGGALLSAAGVNGWFQRQRNMRDKMREARRRNPDLHRSRRSYYMM